MACKGWLPSDPATPKQAGDYRLAPLVKFAGILAAEYGEMPEPYPGEYRQCDEQQPLPPDERGKAGFKGLDQDANRREQEQQQGKQVERLVLWFQSGVLGVSTRMV